MIEWIEKFKHLGCQIDKDINHGNANIKCFLNLSHPGPVHLCFMKVLQIFMSTWCVLDFHYSVTWDQMIDYIIYWSEKDIWSFL